MKILQRIYQEIYELCWKTPYIILTEDVEKSVAFRSKKVSFEDDLITLPDEDTKLPMKTLLQKHKRGSMCATL